MTTEKIISLGKEYWSRLSWSKDHQKYRTNLDGVFIFDNTALNKRLKKEGFEDDGSDSIQIRFITPESIRGNIFGRSVRWLLSPVRANAIARTVYPEEFLIQLSIKDNPDDTIEEIATIERNEDGSFSHYNLECGRQILQDLCGFSRQHGNSDDPSSDISSSLET